MKKHLFVLVTIFLLSMLAACGNEASENAKTNNDKSAKSHENDTEHTGPHEPGKDDTCAFCNMKVHQETDPMGVFTAQAKTAEGEYVFFDDSGCLLNSPRRDDVEYEQKWVRDYVTKEWIDANQAVPVKADLKTPMKYGFAFFKDKASAEKYIADNGDKNPKLATWEQIDQVSNERYTKKMKMMNGKDSDSKEKDGGEMEMENNEADQDSSGQ